MKHFLLILGLLTAGPLQIEASAQEPADADPVSAEATPTPSTAGKPAITELFSLDYDEPNDRFLVPGTTQPFSGPVVSTDDNGKKESEGTLKGGHEEGLWTNYYEDGKKESEGVYKQGNEDGEWKYWHENGQLASKGSYINGSPAGRWFTYFEDGKPDSEGNYVEGLMDGDWSFHDEETGTVTTIQFDKGIQLKP